MTAKFGRARMIGYVFLFLLSATVLGLTANLAKIFLPDIHHDFIIMTLVIASATIFIFIFIFQWSQPKIEVILLFIMGIMWLAIAAFATDTIGNVECYPLFNSQTAAAHGGTTSERQYCYQMKVIEAFSWTLFVLFIIFFIIVISLTHRAQSFGNHHAWQEPIQELPWFGEQPDYYRRKHGINGYENGHGQHQGYGYEHGGQGYGGQQGMYPPGGPGIVPAAYPGMIQQQPGHAVVIQPGHHGMPTIAQQVPTM